MPGAEDGIRTRDPHLGEAVVCVFLAPFAPLSRVFPVGFSADSAECHHRRPHERCRGPSTQDREGHRRRQQSHRRPHARNVGHAAQPRRNVSIRQTDRLRNEPLETGATPRIRDRHDDTDRPYQTTDPRAGPFARSEPSTTFVTVPLITNRSSTASKHPAVSSAFHSRKYGTGLSNCAAGSHLNLQRTTQPTRSYRSRSRNDHSSQPPQLRLGRRR